MLVSKKALALKVAMGNNEKGYDLDYLKLTENRAFATDGALLIEMANPPQELIDEYPDIDNSVTGENAYEAYLSKTTIDKIEKNLPRNPSLPILNNFLISKSSSGDKYQIHMTDLENTVNITQRIPEVSYPDTDKAEPFYQEREKGYSVILNIKKLKKLIQIIEKVQDEKLGIKFYVQDDPEKPIVFEFEEPEVGVSIRGLLGTMRE